MLVQELRHIKSTLPRGDHVSAPIEHLRQHLSAKEEECRKKAEVNKEKDEVLKERDGVIREKETALSLKDEDLRGIHATAAGSQAECRHSEEVVRQKRVTTREQQAEIPQLRDQMAAQQAEIQRLRDQMAAQQAEIQQLRDQPAVSQKVCTSAFLPFLVMAVESHTVTTGHSLNSSIRWLLSVRIGQAHFARHVSILPCSTM